MFCHVFKYSTNITGIFLHERGSHLWFRRLAGQLQAGVDFQIIFIFAGLRDNAEIFNFGV